MSMSRAAPLPGRSTARTSPVAIGERVAVYRRRRGLSQVTLAALIGRSESWLSQVERGVRELDSLAVIRQLAEALDVTAEILVEWPLDRPLPEARHHDADPVRGYLDGYTGLLTDTTPRPAVTPAELLAAADTLNSHYQATRYETALATSPAILAAADTLRHTDTTAASLHAQVAAHVITAKILHKIGEARLAALAADRAASVASHPHADPIDRGLAAREVVLALMHARQTAAAETLAVAMAARLATGPHADSDDALSLRGSLLLLAAVIAARRAARHDALDRLDQAEQIAARLGHDGNHAWTAFGPTNVAIHAVSIAAELGDAGEAVRLARHVDPDHLPAGLTSRRAQPHVDLAWAYAQQRRDADATLQLLEIERIAPQLLHYHPVIRGSIRDLLARTRTGDNSVLHDLAVRCGALG